MSSSDQESQHCSGTNDGAEAQPSQERVKRKTREPRFKWSEILTTDLIDVVLAHEDIKRLLLVRPTNIPTDAAYTRIQHEMQERHPGIKVTVAQLRTKVKSCVTEVNGTLKTIKTATGIASYVDDKGLGEWFPRLQVVLAERDSNNPGTVIEPGAGTPGAGTPPRKRAKPAKAEAASQLRLDQLLEESVASSKRMEANMEKFSNIFTSALQPLQGFFQAMAQQQQQQPSFPRFQTFPSQYPPQQQHAGSSYQPHYPMPYVNQSSQGPNHVMLPSQSTPPSIPDAESPYQSRCQTPNIYINQSAQSAQGPNPETTPPSRRALSSSLDDASLEYHDM